MALSLSLRRSALVLAVAYLATAGRAVAGPSSASAIRVGPDSGVVVPPDVRLPDTPPVYAVIKVDKPPKIDGKLDEECWERARPLGRFYLDSGDGPMRNQTIAHMVRDDTYVYVGVDCKHPKIADVPVRKGTRDNVSWAGETIEMWFDTDRTAPDYVQVIFDMSGAFTDTYGGIPSWNGDITAATHVGGDGWRLEVRLRIADLGGGGKVDRFLWGANVARNSGDESASWARLLGSYQQPDRFGLLTFCDGDLAMDDVGLGLFAPPAEGASVVPVRMTLRNLSATPAEYSLTCATAPVIQSPTVYRRVAIAPSTSKEIVACLPLAEADAIAVTVSAGPRDSKPLFQTALPVRLAKARADCLASPELICAIRPACPVVIAKDQAVVYLMARSLQAEPVQRSGELSLISLADVKVVWQTPVELAMPADTYAAQRVDLPVDKMKDGQYRLEWRLEGGPKPVVLRSDLLYSSLGLAGLAELLSPGGLQDVLAKLKCPVPKDAPDRAVVQVWIDRLTGAVRRQTEQTDLDLSGKILHSYRRLMEVVSALRGGEPYCARQRGWFEAAFFSPVDGSAQPFSLFVPHDYDEHPDREYPLVINLHGAGGTHGGEAGFAPGKDGDVTDRLMLRVLGRGRFFGYGAISADEVVREIREVMDRYRVDADAVHIQGGSMGGFGTFMVASLYPDLFASAEPLCGGGIGMPLEQMCNLPTFVHHGLADRTVNPRGSMISVAQMQRFGCPVQLYLYPGIGHDVGPAAEKIARWETFKDIRRDPQPRTAVVAPMLPPLAKAYWLSVLRYQDIHQHARVRATFAGMNHLDIESDNAAWVKIALPCKWIDPAKPLQITDGTGHRWTELTTGQAKALYINLAGKDLVATTEPPSDLDDPTVYTGGGAHCMFWLGRPVRIVYGTAGAAEQTETLAKLATEISRSTPLSRTLEVGGLPVLKDSEVDEQTLKTCDLIILGTPKDNGLLTKMADRLPVKFQDGRVTIETTPAMSWPADEIIFSLYYRNPLSPERRIWWFAGVQDAKTLSGLAGITRGGYFGTPGPELIVQAKGATRVIATADVVQDWKLMRPGAGMFAKDLWPGPADVDRLYNQALKDSLPADVSLVVSFPRSEVYDWQSLTASEVTFALATGDLVVLPLTGKQLLAFNEKAGEFAKGRNMDPVMPWAGVPAEAIDPDATYDVLVQPEGIVISAMEAAGIPFETFRLVPAELVQAVKDRFLRPKALHLPSSAPASSPAGSPARGAN